MMDEGCEEWRRWRVETLWADVCASRGIVGRRDASYRPSPCYVTPKRRFEDSDRHSHWLQVGDDCWDTPRSHPWPSSPLRADWLEYDRIDKDQSFEDKVSKVEELLARDSTS